MVGEQQFLDVGAAHQAQFACFEGFGPRGAHPHAEQVHLAEHGAGAEDGGGDAAAVRGDPVQADPAAFDDEQHRGQLQRVVDDLPGRDGAHGGVGAQRGHLAAGQVAE